MDKERAKWQTVRDEHAENLGRSVVHRLETKGFEARYAATAEEARQMILSLIPDGASVGIPGSVTLRELGLVELLAERGHPVFQHWDPSLKPEEKSRRLQEELSSDVFLSGSNAITLDGTIVNIDGTGNRVAGLAWGDNRLVIVVGINKICHDLDEALHRVRDVATPPNTQRLKMATPCAATGFCSDCNSPQRVCRAVLILERAPFGRDAHVIVVGESLGF